MSPHLHLVDAVIALKSEPTASETAREQFLPGRRLSPFPARKSQMVGQTREGEDTSGGLIRSRSLAAKLLRSSAKLRIPILHFREGDFNKACAQLRVSGLTVGCRSIQNRARKEILSAWNTPIPSFHCILIYFLTIKIAS